MVEAHRKCLLLVGVGSPTTTGMSYQYLFNLNIDNTFLAYWFFISGIPLWVFSGIVDVVGDLYQKPEANIKLSVLRILCVITISLFNPINVQIKLLSIVSGGIVIEKTCSCGVSRFGRVTSPQSSSPIIAPVAQK